MIKEQVPIFIRRINDQVLEGSNNVTMILGTDRPSTLDSGLGHVKALDSGKGAGTWHIITGRAGKDPNFELDKSFIYVSSKTEIDDNLKLSSVEFNTNVVPGIILKSDSIRIVARKDIKIIAGSSVITMSPDGKIKIGASPNDLNVVENGVVLGGAIDTFTGLKFSALQASSKSIMVAR